MVELDANKAQQTVEPNMQPLSPSQRSHILSLLIGGHSAHQISSSTGISYTSITRLRSKHLPDLPKPTASTIMAKLQKISSFSKIMTPSTQARRPRHGSITMNIKSYHGQHSPQTSIPLNIFGVISREG